MPAFSPDYWRKLSALLDEALDITANERSDWLGLIGADDATLAADLRMLLAEHDAIRETHFLERDAPAIVRPPQEPSLGGQILGAYRLIGPIGRGGMGSVWLAERCDGRFDGRAAVKLLNIALVGRAGEERFRREGTILARLTHPNIAHLIDAGVSPAGQPYLVLEHVDGQNIDLYCDEHALGIEGRVRLFLDVLEAVAHAHAQLVVHRDIKPANVIVSVDGRVKLLDFGIAKLIEPDADWSDEAAGGMSALTREAGAALTPEYAAPEQLAGGLVTTATDVYALGVLLYVLLSGQHPAGAAVRSPAPLMRAIVEVEPRRVSDAVVGRTETAEALTRHAEQCGTTPARLQRILRGDLDLIVAKALKKDAAERYRSVTALADDLRRFLRHEPIGARPDTLRYRATRFVRRHARGVAASAAALVVLGGSAVYHTNRLEAERDRAQREAAKASKVSDLLTGLLTAADPYEIRSTKQEPTVGTLLEARTSQVQAELAGQPDLQAEILTVIGRIYRRMGLYDKAQPLLEQALASGSAAFGAEHVQIAQTLHDLGTVQADKGNYAGAGLSLERSLAMRRRLLGGEHPDVAVTLSELGRVYQDEGFNERAEPLQREALRIRRAALGADDPEVAVSLSDLASVLRLNGDLVGAESLLRQSVDINRKTRGDFHPNTLTSVHDLALISVMRGDYASAESMFRRVLASLPDTVGERHPLVAAVLNNLARVLAREGRYDEAAVALTKALDIAGPALGEDHQLVAIYTTNLASVQLARKHAAEAETLLRRALPIRSRMPGVVPGRRRTLSEDDWSIGATKSLLGAALTGLGRYSEAETALLEARGDLDALPRASALDVKVNVTRLIDLYDAWGKPARAAEFRAAAVR